MVRFDRKFHLRLIQLATKRLERNEEKEHLEITTFFVQDNEGNINNEINQ